tara:strand:+ start:1605 stop:1730 length:126 start_codon:yes stop_codon:yes gene_type:complete
MTEQEKIEKKKTNFFIISIAIGVAVLSFKVFADYKMAKMKV